MLAYKDGERVRLLSRNGRDHTRRFRDIAAAIAKLSARTLVSTARWRSTTSGSARGFDCLREPARDAVATPPLFMLFDLVYRDGRLWQRVGSGGAHSAAPTALTDALVLAHSTFPNVVLRTRSPRPSSHVHHREMSLTGRSSKA
jgi:hypothetical protein